MLFRSGLALSIALMALAAAWIAQLLQRHAWIGYVGLAIIVYVALEMIWRGWGELHPFVATYATAKGMNLLTLYLLGIAGVSLITAAVLGLRKRESARG